uniref:Secreted protein n=1 Tax=Phakopsora pachyrhizi TaxID=170000 RepID=A0A0S1MJ21_PHAPC
MQSNFLLAFCLIAAVSVPVSRAHGVITSVEGANGQTGSAFGMVESTPRDGTRTNPFQTDSSIIRDREVSSGKASACGRTLAGGNNDIASDMSSGGGPYSCEVDTTATGDNFKKMNIDTNVPGKNSRSRAKATEFPLVATMPAGATCTGGADGQTCLVRCRNAANAGPFGGCVAVTQAN